MKSYPALKPSGHDWLPQVPAHWEIKKVKYLFRLAVDYAPENNDFELLSVYTDIGVKPRRELEERGNRASTTDGYLQVQKGDIIVNKLLAWMGAIGVSHYEGVTSPAYDILRPKAKVNSDYYHLLFRCGLYFPEFRRHSRGIMDMRLRLYFDELGQILVPFPPPEEQAAIVAFIEHKAEEINDFIAAKTRSIALLREQKTALINRAVTQGLSASVPRRDSGIDWLGDVPAHWEVKPIKHFVCINRLALSESTFSTYEFDYIDIGNVGTGVIVESPERITFVNAPSRARRIVKSGDTIISTVRTYLKATFHFDKCEDNTIVSTGFAVLTPKEGIVPKYLGYAVQSGCFVEQVTVNSTGISYPAINSTSFGRIPLIMPPLEEQAAIVEHIERETQLIESTITKAEREIELMQELKTSLITAAVTGQIDVRDYQPPTVPRIEYSNQTETHAHDTALDELLDERMETAS